MWDAESSRDLTTVQMVAAMTIKALLLVILLLALVLLFTASGLTAHADGVVHDGYTFHNGYWWRGNRAFTRQLVTSPGYYVGGCYHPGASSYTYTFAYDYVAPVQPVQKQQVNYQDPGWRSKLLDIAAARDKAEFELRKSQFEQAYYSEAIRQLGLEGNFRLNGYGMLPPGFTGGVYGGVGTYGQLTLSSAGHQGSTLYGYSVNSLRQLYGDANLSVLYQQANRLAENAQRLSGQATTDFSALVGQEGGYRAKVAEILAKGQAVQQMLQALQTPEQKFDLKQLQFRTLPGGQLQQMPNADGVVPQVNLQSKVDPAFLAHMTQKCGACHTAPKRQDAFVIADWPNYDINKKAGVIARLVTQDEKERMPRNQDGSVGPQITPAELKLWLAN